MPSSQPLGSIARHVRLLRTFPRARSAAESLRTFSSLHAPSFLPSTFHRPSPTLTKGLNSRNHSRNIQTSPLTRPDIVSSLPPPSTTTSSAPKRIYPSPYFPPPRLPVPSSIFHYHFPTSDILPHSTLRTNLSSDLPAFVDATTGRTYTRGDVYSRSLRLGLGLSRQISSGNGAVAKESGEKRVVLIFSSNSIDFPLIFFAAQAAGLITTLANSGYTPRELAHQILDSGAEAAFVHPGSEKVFREAVELVKEDGEEGKGLAEKLGRWSWAAGPKEERGKEGEGGLRSYEEIMVEEGELGGWEGVRAEKGQEDETALLCYSSGTTGLAKGVMTTHTNINAVQTMFHTTNMALSPEAKDSVLGVLPFYHIYGLTVAMLYPFALGLPNIVLPRFTPQSFLSSIQTHRITYTNIVPPIVAFLANSPLVDKYDLGSLKGLMCGAAPLGDWLVETCQRRIGVTVAQGYGLTETSPVTHMQEMAEAPSYPGSVGKLVPHMAARILDPVSGIDIEPGMAGELVLKGPNVMKGYWMNEEATRETFTEDGWYRTGDIAQIDEDGHYYIVDRLKELIKYKGFQVPPADLEAVLLTHPKVADAGVIGVYLDAEATEVPKAYVVPVGGVEGMTLEERREFAREVVDWTAGMVSNPKKLRGGVMLVEAIPKSASGKILRKDLRLLEAATTE